ncbi:MAG TPA: YraN family protein [Cytophagales bacterium]|nr:YraN family protein [Cytophagales bacterium]
MNKILKTSQIGKQGEDLASSFLQELGYLIVEKNFRFKRFEVDLIAKVEDVLVFVEVKKRKNPDFGFPEAAVTQKKADMIHQVAVNYMERVQWHGHIRFDIIAISEDEVLHLEDAF